MADIGGSNRRSMQVRAVRKDGWTKAKRTIFLSTLAASCNVVAAARAAGMATWSVHKLRKRDGEFAVLWHEALEAGYERLESELLARALGQASSGDNPSRDEIAVPPDDLAPFDLALAIQVLKLRADLGRDRRKTKARQPVAKTQAEVDAALLKRLDALAAQRRRERGEGDA
ncbi:hypothetical protein [Sphingomonas sp. PB4P5]|uniref:hypothetical protein n=1 Tax=Parasphingomonas puruogangriensis TaxID=3096155 RepID=UPI002FC87B71